jgi:hypothetical protein
VVLSRCLATVLAAFSIPAFAQQAIPVWQPHVDVEAKPGSKRSIGEADLFLPVWQDGKGLLFGNARLRVADHDNFEGNLGLGYRRMLEGGWNLGGYGYFDRRRTENNNSYNQFTFGAEALGPDWDFRGNLYRPTGSKVRALDTVNTASISATSVVVSSVTRDERALNGYDAEAGWRLPVFDLMDSRQLRAYLGGYRFSDSAVKVSGPRARIEYAMAELPGLWKGAQLFLGAEYQDDDVRGSQSFLSVRLRIPLGGDKSEGRRMNYQERRMTAPVVRDVDIVAPVVARAPVIESATQTADGRALTVLESGGTNGAAFQAAIAAAGANSTVVLSGNFTTATQTTLQPGQTVAGGGVQVRTPSGRTATLPSTGATWTGNVGGANYTVAMANNSTLQGMTINNTEAGGAANAQAVIANGVSGARIVNNVLNITAAGGSTAHGVDVVGGATNVTISGNRINATAATSVGLGVQVNGAGSSATVSDNIIAVSGGSPGTAGIFVTSGATASTTGNRVTATGTGGAGVAGFRIDNATGVVIANSTITASEQGVNSSNGVLLTNTSSATITGNTISAVANNNAGVATAINVFSAASTVTIANNTLSGSGSTTAGFNRFLSFGAGATVNSGASTGNTAAAGNCLNAGAVGFVSFSNGTTCP